MIHPRYLALLFTTLIGWAAAYCAFTWFIDPYGVAPFGMRIKGINEVKPRRLNIDRMIKPYEVWRHKPRTVFLGTSRIHQAIDPSVLDGTRLAPAYNASIPASPIGLNVSHLRQYLHLDPALQTVVLELFYANFLGQPQERERKTIAEFVRNAAALLFSADALWAAVLTAGYNAIDGRPRYEIKPRGFFSYPPGHDPQVPFAAFFTGIWQLHEGHKGAMKLHEPAFDAVRELRDLARENNIEIVFILTPNHVYDDYYIEQVGEWHTISEWLTRLSSEVELLSFSQPNSWVDEAVKPGMQYWNDPYHPSLRMGRAMQLAIAGLRDEEAPENFFQRLRKEDIAAHIVSRREAVRRFKDGNPGFVAKFAKGRAEWEAKRRKQ
jgi:hypothetical protein